MFAGSCQIAVLYIFTNGFYKRFIQSECRAVIYYNTSNHSSKPANLACNANIGQDVQATYRVLF